MKWNVVQRALLVAAVAGVAALPQSTQRLAPISVNDNRTPARRTARRSADPQARNAQRQLAPGTGGRRHHFGLRVWRGRESSPGTRPHHSGTQGHHDIALHSSLGVPATLHGLHERPGDDKNVVTVAPGATNTCAFCGRCAGHLYYYAQTPTASATTTGFSIRSWVERWWWIPPALSARIASSCE